MSNKIIFKYIIPFIILFSLALIISMNTNVVKFSSDFNPNFIGSNINQYLKKTEEQILDIKEGVEKVIWNKETNKNPIAIVYIHGLIASSEEVRLPDKIASDLNATKRLTGHLKKSKSNGIMLNSKWMRDLHEAIEIVQKLEKKLF